LDGFDRLPYVFGGVSDDSDDEKGGVATGLRSDAD
jgi:hypothetical protein